MSGRGDGGATASARRASGPERSCIGCRQTAPPSELVRVFRSASGLSIGAGPGRGAWLCARHPVECLDRAVKRGAVARALRTTVEAHDVEELRAKLVH